MVNNFINLTKVYAAEGVGIGVGIPGSSRTSYTYATYIADMYGFALKLGSALAVLMIIYAGYRYITSAGNQTAIGEAKEIFLGAILGLATLWLVKLILSFLALPDPTKTTSTIIKLFYC
ncbi:MAG: hypothetical protein AAB360_00905 [Patescibacteria group bacterium]